MRRGTPAVGDLVLFPVDDTLSALGLLARARRRAIDGPVVAVTGSNGKTSTRAMLAAALSPRWRTHATRENLNNLVGVPLTILEAPDETEALVVECGANLPGELARLRAIVEPTVGVVTNVGASHLAGFGSREGVLREKVSLLADVPCAVVGQRPPELAALARRVARRTVVAGLGPRAGEGRRPARLAESASPASPRPGRRRYPSRSWGRPARSAPGGPPRCV